MGKRCEQKIQLLTLMHNQRIEEINFEFEKKLKEKDKQIKDLNLSKETIATAFYKNLENMAKNTDSEIEDLKAQIEEKDNKIKDINLAKENLETSFYKRLNNMSKNYMGRINDLKTQIEEKDKEISRLRIQLDHKDCD